MHAYFMSFKTRKQQNIPKDGFCCHAIHVSVAVQPWHMDNGGLFSARHLFISY